MSLEKLELDWKEHPCLRFEGYDTVEQLRDHLLSVHRRLLGPEAGVMGYLYQQQTRRVRELQKELDDVSKRKTGGR